MTPTRPISQLLVALPLATIPLRQGMYVYLHVCMYVCLTAKHKSLVVKDVLLTLQHNVMCCDLAFTPKHIRRNDFTTQRSIKQTTSQEDEQYIYLITNSGQSTHPTH